MKVAVTGAAGFVGLNVVEALLEQGYEPIAVVRESTNTAHLERFPVESRKGDVCDRSSLERAFRGVDAVIHVAGNTSGFGFDRKSQYETNVVGTSNVVSASLACGIRRLVHTSTTSTIGTTSGRASSEETPLNGFRRRSQYGVSKLAAERVALAANQQGLPTVVLNPAEVMGAYDHHFGWGSVVLGLKTGTMPFVPAGGGSFCHAREVGRAHVRALSSGRPGERYILAGTDVTYAELFETVGRIVRASVPKRRPVLHSRLLLATVFGIQELAYPLTKKKPLLDQNRIRAFSKPLYFSSKKACDELGFRVRPIEDMVADCYYWYRDAGLIS